MGVGAAVAALRRVTVSPLGVRRRERRGPLRRLRLLPLAVSLVVFGYVLSRLTAADGDASDNVLWLLAGSFFAIIVSIAIAGPWITAIVGRLLGRVARGPVPLLAGRRLADDPRGAFGAIGGVVMAVFVGSAFLSIAAFAASASPADERLAVRPDVLMAALPGDGSGADDAARTISAMAGVAAVAQVREVSIDGGGRSQLGVIAACPTLVEVLSAPEPHLRPGPRPPRARRQARHAGDRPDRAVPRRLGAGHVEHRRGARSTSSEADVDTYAPGRPRTRGAPRAAGGDHRAGRVRGRGSGVPDDADRDPHRRRSGDDRARPHGRAGRAADRRWSGPCLEAATDSAAAS